MLDASRTLEDFPRMFATFTSKQVAEAEILLLSKSDLSSVPPCLADGRARSVSARTGAGVDEWISIILGQTSRNPEALVIDYARYAEAEAALGWLNAKGHVRADTPYSARRWTADF